MHVLFRTLGQAMGLQLVRAILPESIDTYLNDAIVDTVRKIVLSNSTMQFQDKVTIQNDTISPINAIRTLYKRNEIDLSFEDKLPIHLRIANLTNVMYFCSFALSYGDGRYIKCRFVEPDKVEDTNADYCNRASVAYPIVTMFDDNGMIIEIQNGTTDKVPQVLLIRYIENPAIVHLDDNEDLCVDCNLPDYLHHEIVETAVQKYFSSVGSTFQNIQS